MTASFDFYDKPGYLRELIRSAQYSGPGDRLTVMAIAFDASVSEINDLGDALAGAATRGAEVRLIVDAYTFIFDHNDRLGPAFTKGAIDPANLRGVFLTTYNKLEQLKAAGGSYYIINQPPKAFRFPYAGRSHIKLAIINDRFFIGGCNLDDASYLDVMVSWENAPTANILNGLVDTILDDGIVRDALRGEDQTFMLGLEEDMKILVDCGVRHQSIILHNAHKLIDEAKERIIITCQYFPGGETGRRLLAAHKRGVEVKIYYSHPTVHGKLAFIHHLHGHIEKRRLPESFFENRLSRDVPKLHAKILITESAAMMGSHNYVGEGVNFGTAEIALLNRQPEFVKQLRSFTEELILQ